MVVAVAVAETAAEVADTRSAACPAVVSARHTAVELSEQAESHIALAVAQETETRWLQDIPSPDSVGTGEVAVAETEVAEVVDTRSVEGFGIAVESLVGPEAVVVPSNCCTFWETDTTDTGGQR